MVEGVQDEIEGTNRKIKIIIIRYSSKHIPEILIGEVSKGYKRKIETDKKYG